jgi:hypothetical protein
MFSKAFPHARTKVHAQTHLRNFGSCCFDELTRRAENVQQGLKCRSGRRTDERRTLLAPKFATSAVCCEAYFRTDDGFLPLRHPETMAFRIE